MFINICDREERNNGLKTFLIGGSFIMCLWIGCPFLIHRYIDPKIGGFHNAFLKGLGGPVSLMGYALAVWCVMLFIKKGQGTPLPYFHPKKLVSIGPYRYVSNPMVLGTVIFLLGSGFLLGSWGILAYAAVIFFIMHLFVLVEERSLTVRFGDQYAAYVRATPRWWPRFHK